MLKFDELDIVVIPNDLAHSEQVNQTGTVVWHGNGGPLATVECTCLSDNSDGWRTKLLDIEICDLIGPTASGIALS
jgi:hypothetical protein